jgi:hypothetical protein
VAVASSLLQNGVTVLRLSTAIEALEDKHEKGFKLIFSLLMLLYSPSPQALMSWDTRCKSVGTQWSYKILSPSS